MTTLHGRSRSATDKALCDTDILLRDAQAPSLPDRLHEVQWIELDSPQHVPRRFELVSGQQRLTLQARTVQSHRAVGAAMFAAVPATPLPWSLRAGWSLLLSVLRIPGVGRLLLRQAAS
jgi:hypothetical protein